MIHRIRIALIAVLACMPPVSVADDSEIGIEDFSFLSGYWVGEGFGGVSEEIWMPPSGGRMFGIFKQSNDAELNFTEFIEITSVDGEYLLRLKHFNADFTGWEEKDGYVTFKLQSVEPNKAVFGGLSYELIESDQLRVSLRLRESDGTVHTEVFNFKRQPSS